MSDELLVKYMLDEASAAERDDVHQWINASSENKRYFNHFQLIWETSKQLVIPPTVNADEAWTRFQQRTEQASKKQAVIKQMKPLSGWMRAASIVILIVGVATISYFLSKPSSSDPITVSTSGNPVIDTLPDGSFVTLNKNSSIRYLPKFSGNKRKVELEGEAFFSVSPDKEKPFVVNVNDITVTVVGTSFNIKSIGGKTQVIVESGIVQVTKNNKTVELKPKEKLLTNATDTVMTKEDLTDRLHEYYRSKVFVCDSTPLWKLVEVLNEVYNANIIIEKK